MADGVVGDDEPIAPGVIETPVMVNAAARADSKERDAARTTTTKAGTEEARGDTSKVAERRQLLRKIDVAAALGKSIAENNPELTAAPLFLNAVCGRVNELKKQQVEEADSGIVASAARATTPPLYLSTVTMSEQVAEEPPLLEEVPCTASARASKTGKGGGDVESDSDHDEGEVVELDDTEMSAGNSSEDESQTHSSSAGSSSSSDRSRVSRKRAAEESPERELSGPSCQKFPGTISRGAGGCRIYVPAKIMVTEEGTGVANPDGATFTEITANRQSGTTAESPRCVSAVAPVGPPNELKMPVARTTCTGAAPNNTTTPPTYTTSAGDTTKATDGVQCARDLVVRNVAMGIEEHAVALPERVRTKPTSFVAVTTVVNIPAQLLTNATICVLADEEATESVNVAAQHDASAVPAVAAATMTSEWGRQGFIIAEIHRILATMEPPWGSLCVLRRCLDDFPR